SFSRAPVILTAFALGPAGDQRRPPEYQSLAGLRCPTSWSTLATGDWDLHWGWEVVVFLLTSLQGVVPELKKTIWRFRWLGTRRMFVPRLHDGAPGWCATVMAVLSVLCVGLFHFNANP